MKYENILKGKIASSLVALMFESQGYKVYRYGFEGTSEVIIQNHKEKLAKNDDLKLITNTPHFVVIDETSGNVSLVTVKFLGKESLGRNIFWGYQTFQKMWPSAKIIVVQATAPHFSEVVEEKRELILSSLEKSKYLKINKKTAGEFGSLVQKFLTH